MTNKEDIIYKCKLSSQLTDLEKDSFINIFNRVFHEGFDQDWFNWKYIDNIYGDSYIVLAYSKDDAIGARAFWRNDIDGQLCYQPCDTAVVEEFRGRGIFSKMTLAALEDTKGSYIYNYPNENSRPGYLKLGWKVNKYFYLKFVLNRNRLKRDCEYIDDDYLVWKFGKSPVSKYYYYEKDGESYLLYNRKNNIYYILGRFNGEYNNYFTKVDNPILFNYTAKETLLYKLLKNRGTIVSFDNGIEDGDIINIPIYKGDFF